MMEVKSEYKMTEIGKIPVDWKLKKLEEVTTIVSGGTPSKENNKYWNNGDILWATPTDITKNKSKYINDTKMKISEQGLNESSASLLPEGSVLMTSRATIGEKSINLKPMATNQGFKSFICKNSLFNEYLYYYIEILKPLFLSKSSGSTFLELSKKSTEDQLIALPLLKEQQKIAEILSTVDEQIEQTDQLIEKTKELKKGLLQQLLTKGIGHTEFKQSEIGEIPVEWDLKKIGEICTFSQGLQVPVEEQYDDDGDDKVQFLRIVDYTQNNAQPRYIKKTEKKYFISKEDLIMIRYGNPGFVGIGREGVIANNMFKIIPEFGNITTRYLYIYLSQKNIKLKIKKMSTSTTMPAISFKTIADLPIVIPTINEQQKIAEIISSVDEDIEGYEEEKLKYEELKKGLMQQLLTGKTRLKVD